MSGHDQIPVAARVGNAVSMGCWWFIVAILGVCVLICLAGTYHVITGEPIWRILDN